MKGLVAEAAGEKAGEGRPFCFPPIRKERRNNKPTVVYWTESKTRLKLWEFLEFSHYFKSKPQLFLENKVQKTPKIKPRQDHNQDYTSVYAAEVWGVGVVPACDGAGGRHWEESQQSPEKPQLLHLWQFWQDLHSLNRCTYLYTGYAHVDGGLAPYDTGHTHFYRDHAHWDTWVLAES